ncbi:hypothetical protein MKW94_000355 [Papaver nudicaule]|uniref:Uncharacterized protein n=1 Tax=Papaver nudicaule TaxID=74823 RepID=A0AA41RTD2_PAPNU|nr:hypothetical protein [Papaver nudicaule]
MATKQNLSIIGFFFALIALQQPNVNAQMHICFSMNRPHPQAQWTEGGFTCAGPLQRWRYSPTDDVQGDCMAWCQSFTGVTIFCAQMNVDENQRIYCACYEKCDPNEEWH